VLELLPGPVLRLLRRLLLALARRMDPQRMLRDSQRGAQAAARRAARLSPAYRSLLAERGVSIQEARLALADLPVLTKANTFERFPLEQLAGRLEPKRLADVLTSSGRGGGSFGFKLTSRRQHDASWFDIDLGLQDAFDVDRRPTLLVNCLPMGVVFRSRAVTVANVSVREDMACSILRDVGPRFAQTIVCTDPLFVKRLLDHASATGVDWRALNASLIVGEEVLVEAQRDYIARRIGLVLDADDRRMIASSFGVGELGLNLLFESRETIALRRAMRRQPEVARLLRGGADASALPSLFCFNPLRCHVEVLSPDDDGFGELCFTLLERHPVIPLPRYATGDLGRLVDPKRVAEACSAAGIARPWLPLAVVRGRMADRSPGLPSVEDVKEAMYSDPAIADRLTGAFRLATGASGVARLLLQAQSQVAAADGAWAASVARHFDIALGHAVEAVVVGPSEFPFRPALDYERKFRYVGDAMPSVSKSFTT